jgi:predicted RNA-binding protein with PIN domain
MSWLSKLFGGDSSAASAGASRIIVDGSRWMDARGNDRQSPRDQVQILQVISRFTRQEKIETQVVFEGRPLREVSEDGEFNGVKVFFTEKQGSAGDLVVSRARSTGPRGLLVFTADQAVEQKVSELGCIIMHPSTLRKAIEGGSGSFDERQGGAPMGRRGGGDQRRRPMGNRPQQRPQQQRPSAPAEGAVPTGASAPSQSSNQSVRNLIDLVEDPVRPAVPPSAPAAVQTAPAPQLPSVPAPAAPHAEPPVAQG